MTAIQMNIRDAHILPAAYHTSIFASLTTQVILSVFDVYGGVLWDNAPR